jgi:hypothetical protein
MMIAEVRVVVRVLGRFASAVPATIDLENEPQ